MHGRHFVSARSLPFRRGGGAGRNAKLLHEDAEEAYANADVVLLGTVTGVKPENPVLATCTYTADKVFKHTGKGVRADGAERTTPAPIKVKIGDRLILLFRYDGNGELRMYSGENFLFLADSQAGRKLLAMADKGYSPADAESWGERAHVQSQPGYRGD